MHIPNKDYRKYDSLFDEIGKAVLETAISLGLKVPEKVKPTAERYVGMSILTVLCRRYGQADLTKKGLVEYLMAYDDYLKNAINFSQEFRVILECVHLGKADSKWIHDFVRKDLMRVGDKCSREECGGEMILISDPRSRIGKSLICSNPSCPGKEPPRPIDLR